MTVWLQEFTVEGTRSFPVDMMRYDYCYPASESDAGTVETMLRGHRVSDGPVRVRLLRRTPNRTLGPTVGRWESFGWKVVSEMRPVKV